MIMQKIIVIVGPTGIGKTELAIKLAQKLNAEIISGDSMQIYQEVNIGTAKPTFAERAAVKHYLVDQQSIFTEYSVKEFVSQASKAIDEITAKGKIPLVVGGTGFYINALINKLNEKDPITAAKIPYQNHRRVLRALSVISRTGKLFSDQQVDIEPRYDALIIGLNSDRQQVYERINNRIDKMMASGLLTEAEMIYHNLDKCHQVVQAIGYKEFFPYFKHEADLSYCVDKLKQASRKYAKRQITYFRHQLCVKWLDPLKDDHILDDMLILSNNFIHKKSKKY
jgi:tRNA dimethylallyltransferase